LANGLKKCINYPFNNGVFKIIKKIFNHWKIFVKALDIMLVVATPLRTGGARWAARDHPTLGAFLLQLRVPVLELWLSVRRNDAF
jgi:hypothetical protein